MHQYQQKGQVILILILVMTVALAIGLSVIQRSLSDISTATKVEQSSRAYSAAEAGIENYLIGGSGSVKFSEIGATASVTGDLIPCVPGASGCAQVTGSRQDPLEYPSLSKEEIAQVWLANYASTTNPPPPFYKQTSLDVYWGSPTATDKAALELTLVYYGTDPTDPIDPSTTKYRSRKWYLDQTIRSPVNNFDLSSSCTGGYTLPSGVSYQCKKTLGDTTGVNNGPLQSNLMLLRARLLYNNTPQPFAVQATCSSPQPDCSLPKQARILTATGTAGNVQRKVRLFQEEKVAPGYFDFGIFSVGTISK